MDILIVRRLEVEEVKLDPDPALLSGLEEVATARALRILVGKLRRLEDALARPPVRVLVLATGWRLNLCIVCANRQRKVDETQSVYSLCK